MTSWVARAERALGPPGGALESRSPQLDRDEVVLRGGHPPLLDAEGVRAVASPLFCALLWAAAVFRETLAGTSVDPIAFALRVVALGLTLRVLLLGARMLERLALWAQAKQHALVLTREGLFYRAPEADYAIPREEVLGVIEQGSWQERRGSRRATSVYVVTDPAGGRTHVALPPIFDGSPGRLAERLMRWRGGWDEPDEPPNAPAHELASKVYDDAAAGRADAGVAAIRHDRSWMKQGPYLVLLIGVAAAEGILRGGPRVWQAIDPAIGGGLVIVLVAMFLRWFWMQRREIAPRKGLAMVLTPAELLIRTRGGMLRARWADLVSASVTTKRAWSVLEGVHDARQLVISRRGAAPIRYDEPYLGAPCEVAQVLIEAYRVGRLPAPPG